METVGDSKSGPRRARFWLPAPVKADRSLNLPEPETPVSGQIFLAILLSGIHLLALRKLYERVDTDLQVAMRGVELVIL